MTDESPLALSSDLSASTPQTTQSPQVAWNADACSVQGCVKAKSVRGLCHMHYSRWKRTGTTDARPAPTKADDDARFMSKIDRRGDRLCWPWLGTVLNTGYGQFKAAGQRISAHRYAYELFKGPIPDGLTIDHVKARGCVRRDCVNPYHLEAVTIGENVRRAFRRIA